jgi:hypothetical protein
MQYLKIFTNTKNISMQGRIASLFIAMFGGTSCTVNELISRHSWPAADQPGSTAQPDPVCMHHISAS